MKRENRTREYLELTGRIRRILEVLVAGENVRVTFQEASGEEGQDMLIVSRSGKGQMVIQCYHMEDIWKQYQEGITVEQITGHITEAIEQYKEIARKNPVKELNNYETSQKNLIIRPKNYPMNKEKLDQGICEVVGDIALALYVSVGNYRHVYSSYMVPKTLLKQWNKSAEEVLEAAKHNTYELFPPRTYQWYDCFDSEDKGTDFMSYEGGQNFHRCPWGIFLSNENHLNGAVSIFLPGVARRLSELMDSDLYIGFTSMHEAVVHDCDSVSPKDIAEAVAELNRDIPAPEDFLSEKVYYYNRIADTLQMSVVLN